jgi:autotransporter strand-loop-strand O-heptosyltransferase
MADTENFALGVELGAMRPHLAPLPEKRLHAKPYVTICNYTTQKVKHMLSNKAWMTIIKKVKSFGFDVINVGNSFTTFPEVIEGCSQDIFTSMRYIRDAEFHIGLSSGLSWMAWAYGKHVLMINNFTHEGYEFIEGNTRILNNSVSYGHFNNPDTEWEPTWQFDPDKDNHTQSCRSITPEMLLKGFDELMRKRAIGSMEGTYLSEKDGGIFKPIKPLYPDVLPLIYTRDGDNVTLIKDSYI